MVVHFCKNKNKNFKMAPGDEVDDDVIFLLETSFPVQLKMVLG